LNNYFNLIVVKENNRNRIDLVIFIFFFIITSIGLLFRNFLNYNDVVQFAVDCLGNIGGVIVGSYLFIWWSKEFGLKNREIIILSVGLGLVIYEFLQKIIPWQTFDIKDIFGTLIGVLIATLINILIVISKSIKKKDNLTI
jgi:hypothetical protein